MCVCLFFFFFKQKTAYEMRISDWSSDVCSSDLRVSRSARNEQRTFGGGAPTWTTRSSGPGPSRRTMGKKLPNKGQAASRDGDLPPSLHPEDRVCYATIDHQTLASHVIGLRAATHRDQRTKIICIAEPAGGDGRFLAHYRTLHVKAGAPTLPLR